MPYFTPEMLQHVDEGSCVAAAQAMDALCVARDEVEMDGGDTREICAAIRELAESIEAHGYALRFDHVAGCHVVEVQITSPKA